MPAVWDLRLTATSRCIDKSNFFATEFALTAIADTDQQGFVRRQLPGGGLMDMTGVGNNFPSARLVDIGANERQPPSGP